MVLRSQFAHLHNDYIDTEAYFSACFLNKEENSQQLPWKAVFLLKKINVPPATRRKKN